MQLDDDARRLLDGAGGEAARKSMEILVALGTIYEAERLIPVRSAQISGVSYANLGDAGLELLEAWARDGRVACPSTLNPAGMDLVAWRAMGIPEEFAERQLRIVRAYERMGVVPSCTCTPYFAGNRPAAGEHVAWSESSAVTFANSVLGARTNREGGPSALAAALCGRTPDYGLHRDGPRAPQFLVRVEAPLPSAAHWGALGAALGRLVPGRVPLLELSAGAAGDAGAPPEEHLMALSAALPTFGGTSIFHVAGVTPEAGRHPRPADGVAIGRRDVAEAFAALDDGVEPDLVFVGCPHASLATLRRVAGLLGGRPVRRTLWVATSRAVRERAVGEGLVGAIEASGGLVVADTCFVVAPLAGRFRAAVTDSAKGCFYARGPNAMKVRLASLEECVEAAVGGSRES
ncbi:MAG: aconitase X catalytic domain-containing protein [Deltaproteobacteria bacterium]|nr:aconitase X catalytic domain-containing protein [Deltaproteobacteria bacterium]